MAASSEQRPSCELFDLVVDLDWDAVKAHAAKHPVDAQWEDHDGRDGGETPLYLASQYGAPADAVQAIIAAYPQALRIQQRNGNSPLHIACYYDADIDIIRALVEADLGTVYLGTKWGKTPMNALYDGILKRADRTDICTIEDEQWEKMKILLRAVALEENLLTSDGEILYVHSAVSLRGSGCPRRVFELTMSRYPDQTSKRDATRRLPIHVAAGPMRRVRFRHFDRPSNASCEQHVFEELIGRSPEAPCLADAQGRWPLHIAVSNGRTWKGGVEALFAAAPNALAMVDPVTGLLPFMLAAQGDRSNLDTVFLLLISQPDVLSACRPIKESKVINPGFLFQRLVQKFHWKVNDMQHERHYIGFAIALCSVSVGLLIASKQPRDN